MFKLLWCLAIACGPADLKTDLASPGYSKEQCVEAAQSRLNREPNMMFICREFVPAIEQANLNRVMDAVRNNSRTLPKMEDTETIFIGPRTLSY